MKTRVALNRLDAVCIHLEDQKSVIEEQRKTIKALRNGMAAQDELIAQYRAGTPELDQVKTEYNYLRGAVLGNFGHLRRPEDEDLNDVDAITRLLERAYSALHLREGEKS